MSPRIASVAFVIFFLYPGYVCAQSASAKPVEIKGHVIGESVAELLSKEPEVRQRVSTCERSAWETDCDALLGAVRSGVRATVSISDWTSFVVDGGRLVKVQTLVRGEAVEANADLTKKFGPRSNETAFPMRNAIGQSWEDHLYVWETPSVFAGLREDNNPASQNHHLVLVVESRAEHQRDHSIDAIKSSARNEN